LYQEIIGILRWAIELGRLDILFEVAILSQCLANPRKGHLEKNYHLSGYQKRNCKRTLYLDPDELMISEEYFIKFERKNLYKGVVEPIPHNMPNPIEKLISLHVFIDFHHAGDKSTSIY